MKRLSLLIAVIILGVISLIICEPNGFRHNIIAGNNYDFMIVNHYVIEGTNYEVGRRIAIIAIEMNINLTSANPLRNRMQVKYMEQNYPIHYKRMKGVADIFGINAVDYSVDISGISIELVYKKIKTSRSAISNIAST